ncbi:hypothetical protein [Sulfurimonas sp. HSL-1716]|uniref:hypothetical protein n=1 Tax=Hydrocurvibacter sulfurireducens TaxID=3131937 RepID=UPI0031F9A6B6
MLQWLKKMFYKEPERSNDFPIDVEELLKKCRTLTDYINVLELTIDECCGMFEKKFDYKDKSKIYLLLANIFARASDHENFSKAEDKIHYNLLSIIINRSDPLNEEAGFKNFEESITYIQSILSAVIIDDDNAMFIVSNAYASYLYPDTDLYKLSLQALMINDFFAPINILAKEQKKFFIKLK